MIALSSLAQTDAAIARARDVTFSAYVLHPGATFDALCSAAKSGAAVRVRLEAHPYADDGTLSADNERAVATLRRCGADARLSENGGPHDHKLLHIKAAVCDGVVYLDDRNWAGDDAETIVRDDFAPDARAASDAIRTGHGSANRFFATRKDDALQEEALLIRAARPGDTLDVHSESFSGSAVSVQLRKAAQRGVKCRLEVARRDVKSRELAQLKHLAEYGIEVRIGDSDEKMAVLNGRRVWVGSANASSIHGNGDQLDWGLRTDAPDVVHELQAQFNAAWDAGTTITSFE